jgi:hypothetical protein
MLFSLDTCGEKRVRGIATRGAKNRRYQDLLFPIGLDDRTDGFRAACLQSIVKLFDHIDDVGDFIVPQFN